MPWRRLVVWMLTSVALPVVAAPIAIQGRIVDGDLQPVADAVVRLVPAFDRYAFALEQLAGTFEALVWITGRPETLARTDRAGDFQLASTGAGVGGIGLSAAAPGYLPSSARATSEDGDAAADLILARCSALRGRVVDERGEPVAGVEILAISRPSPRAIPFGRRRARVDRHTARSDAGGRFRIRSLVPEMHFVSDS